MCLRDGMDQRHDSRESPGSYVAPALARDAASSSRMTLRAGWISAVIATGIATCVLAVGPAEWASEDARYSTVKRLALAMTAVIAALTAVRDRRHRQAPDTIDAATIGWLAVMASTIPGAANPWLGMKALSLAATGSLVFGVTRRIDPREHAAMWTAIVAVMGIAAASALAEAYGLAPRLSRGGRAPGGLVGNRNELAHAIAIAAPLLIVCALDSTSTARRHLGLTATALASASLMLTRCRAAWLATLIVAMAAVIIDWRDPRWRAQRGAWRRARYALLLTIAAGVAATVVLPNRLRWTTASPLMQTMANLTNAREGSGHDRMVQYGYTMALAAAHPLMGVGFGNWHAGYTAFVAGSGARINAEEINSLPSSDWIGILAEGGVAGLVATLALGAVLLRAGVRRRPLGSSMIEATTRPRVIVATGASIAIIATLDSPLARPVTLMIAAVCLGLLLPRSTGIGEWRLLGPVQNVVVPILCLGAVLGDGARLLSVQALAGARTADQIARVIRLDPSFPAPRIARIEALAAEGRCREAVDEASALRRLEGYVPARLLGRCDPGRTLRGRFPSRPHASDARMPSNPDRSMVE